MARMGSRFGSAKTTQAKNGQVVKHVVRACGRRPPLLVPEHEVDPVVQARAHVLALERRPHRLDEHLELFGLPHTPSEKPSEQFRRQGFVSVEEVEPGLESTLAAYPESIVFASDYPHGDGVFPGSTTELLETDRLDESQRGAVLAGNARRLYGL